MDFADIINASKATEEPLNGTKKQKEKQRLANEAKKSLGVNGLAARAFAANPILGYTYKPNKDYRENGIVQTHLDNAYDLNNRLVDNQSVLSQFGNSLVRIVGDTLLDTGAAFSDLATMPYDIVTRIFGNNERDYQNPVSKLLDEWKTNLDEEFKIYTRPGATIKDGSGIMQTSWIFDNLPSLFSSLTMLIPSKAATVGTSKLFKYATNARKAYKAEQALNKARTAEQALTNAERVGRTTRAETAAEIAGRRTSLAELKAAEHDTAGALNKETTFWEKTKNAFKDSDNVKGAADVVANATISRMLENYQESRGVYNQSYKQSVEYLDTLQYENPEEYDKLIKSKGYEGMSNDEIAKRIAGDAADLDFKENLKNLTFDIIQFAALRNMWKGKSSVLDKSNWVKAAQTESKAMLAKAVKKGAATEAAEKVSIIGRALKPITYTGKKAWQNKGFIASESTEGIEEIVNYISEQEGIHLSKHMLNIDDGKSNDYNTRMLNYFKDDALWDSAFWGFMGGLLFGSVGDRVMNYAQNKSWHSAQENAQKKIIEGRYTTAMTGFARLSELNNGYRTDDKGHHIPIAMTPEQIEQSKTKVVQDTIRDMCLNEAQTGTLDYLQDWLADDNLRKLFVEKNILTEEESVDTMNRIKQEASKIQDLYDTEMNRVSKMVKNINGSINGNIIPQYIDLIATQNVRNRLDKETGKAQLVKVTNEINKDVTDPNLTTYRSLIASVEASNNISQLEELKEKIKQNKKLGDELDIKTIDDEINNIKKQFADSEHYSPINNAFIQLTSKLWETVDDNGIKYRQPNIEKVDALTKDDYIAIDKSITEEDYNKFKEARKQLGEFKDNLDTNELFNNMKREASLQAGLNILDAQYIDSHVKLVNHLDNYNALFSDMFKHIMDNAVSDMVKYTEKYNTEDKPYHVQKVLQKYLDANNDPNFDKTSFDREGISEEDFNSMLEHIDAITIKSAIDKGEPNKQLAQNLGRLMTEMENKEKWRKAIKEREKQDKKQQISRTTESNNDTDNNQDNKDNKETKDDKTKRKINVKPEPRSQKQLDEDAFDATGFKSSDRKYDSTNKKVETFSFRNDLLLDENIPEKTEGYETTPGYYLLKADTIDYIHNPNLYEEVRDIDWSKPVIVASHPFIRKNENDITVVRPGIVRNARPSDVNATAPVEGYMPPAPDSTSNEEHTILPNPEDEDDNAKRKVVAQQKELAKQQLDPSVANRNFADNLVSDINLTRGAFLAEFQKPEVVKELSNLSDPTEIKKKIDEIANRIADSYKDDFSIESVKQVLANDKIRINAALRKGKLDAALDKQLESFRKYALSVQRQSIQESAILTAHTQASYFAYSTPDKVYENTKGAIEDMLKEYAKQSHSLNINGKKYINLSRLYSQMSDDVAKTLFPLVESFIESSDEYIAVDGNESPEFLLNQTSNIVLANTNNESIRIDLWDMIDKQLVNEKDFWNEFDKLEKGEEVSFKVGENGTRLTILSSRNEPIGILSVPTTGHDSLGNTWYHNTVRGLVYHLTKDQNGKYTGAIIDMIKGIFDINNTNTNKIRNDLFDLAFGKPSNPQTLIDSIINDPYFDTIIPDINKSYRNYLFATYNIDGDNRHKVSKPEEIVKGLTNLAKFITNPSNVNTTMNDIGNTLDNYFSKIYENYAETVNIASNPNTLTYKISNINEGYYHKNGGKLTPVKESVANLNSDIRDPNAHRIGVRTINGLAIAGSPINKISNGRYKFDKPGTTFMVMPIRGRALQYILARPIPLSDIDGEVGKNIIDPIYDYISSLVNTICRQNNSDNSAIEKAYNELYNFLLDNFHNEKGNNQNRLFYGAFISKVSNKSGEAIKITDKLNGNYIYINKGGSIGVKTIVTSNNDEVKPDFSQGKDAIFDFLNSQHILLNENFINDDTINRPFTHGIVSRDRTGKFVIRVPSINGKPKIYAYPSFNSFILDNNLLSIDTHIENGSNFTRRNPYNSIQATIEIQTEENYNATEKTEKSIGIYKNRILELENKIKDICNSNSENQGVEIATAIIEYTNKYIKGYSDELKELLDLIKINADKLVILPKIVKFVENKEEFKELHSISGAWAAHNSKNNTTYIGSNFMTLLDTSSIMGTDNKFNPTFAISTLIHEQLHGIFKDTKYSDIIDKDIKTNVYKEFIRSLGLQERNVQREMLAYTPQFKGDVRNLNDTELNETIVNLQSIANNISHDDLEEFVIRSLTDRTLMTYLNNTEHSNPDNRTANEENLSIFQKLINTLLKIFGFKNINKKGILYREYLALGEAINITDIQLKAKEITDGSTQFKLNGEDYTDGLDRHWGRPTTVLKAHPHGKDTLSEKKGKDFADKYYTVSTNIGTGMDDFVRDVLTGELDNYTAEQLQNIYPNATGEDLTTFRTQINNFKTECKAKGITLISKDVTIGNTLPVYDNDLQTEIGSLRLCGTVDLLGYDTEGKWHLYDMKTMTHDKSEIDDTTSKWQLQLNLYKMLLEKTYGIHIEDLHIIPIRVSYNANNKYERKYPEDYNYTDPNRSQLLENGEEYKGALNGPNNGLEQQIDPLSFTNKTTTSLINIPINDNIKFTLDILKSYDKADLTKYVILNNNEGNEVDEGNNEGAGAIIPGEDEAASANFDDYEDDYDDNGPSYSNIIPTSEEINGTNNNPQYNALSDFLNRFKPEIRRKLEDFALRGEFVMHC